MLFRSLVKPGIIAGSILVFIPSLGAYVTPRVLGGGKNLMLGNLIELQFGQGRNWPLGAALSITLMVVVMAALLAKAKAIHNRVLKLDTHNDIDASNFTPDCNYTMRLATQVNLPKMAEGDMDVAFFIVYVGQGLPTAEAYDIAYKQAIEKFEAIHNFTEKIAPQAMGLALTPKDVRRLHKQGKRIAVIGVENAYPIGTDIKRVKEFYDRGARYMSLAHDANTQLADSQAGEALTGNMHAPQHLAHLSTMRRAGRQAVIARKPRDHGCGLARDGMHQLPVGQGLGCRHQDALLSQMLHERQVIGQLLMVQALKQRQDPLSLRRRDVVVGVFDAGSDAPHLGHGTQSQSRKQGRCLLNRDFGIDQIGRAHV